MNLCDSSWSTIVFPKLFCFLKRKKFEVYNAESGMIGQVNTSPPLHYHYQHHQPKTYAPIVALPAIFIIRTYKFGTITGYMFINRDLISFFNKSDTRHLTTYVNFNSSILNLFTVFTKTLRCDIYSNCLVSELLYMGFTNSLNICFFLLSPFFSTLKNW